ATRGRADLRQGGGVRSPDQGHGERRPGRPLPRREGFSRSAAHCGGRSGAVPGEGPRGQLCGRGGIAVSRLSVIALSQAFQGFWSDLALDLGTAIDLVGPAEAVTSSPEMAAVIVAAGGAEREAVQWLESHPVPAGVPALVVGTDTGRRTAMQLVTHGASHYFALPDDLEIFRHVVASAVNAARARAIGGSNGHADAFAAIVGESQAIKKDLARAVRGGGPRHAVPRRDRRPAAQPASQAPACAGGQADPPGGRYEIADGRRTHSGGDQRASRSTGARGAIPGRSLLPLEQRRAQAAAPAGAGRRSQPRRAGAARATRPGARSARADADTRSVPPAARPSLAREHPRAQERARAGAAPVPRGRALGR